MKKTEDTAPASSEAAEGTLPPTLFGGLFGGEKTENQ